MGHVVRLLDPYVGEPTKSPPALQTKLNLSIYVYIYIGIWALIRGQVSSRIVHCRIALHGLAERPRGGCRHGLAELLISSETQGSDQPR